MVLASRTAVAAWAVLCMGFAGIASPAAASVTIGQTGADVSCGGGAVPYSFVQVDSTGPSYVVPAGGGVITSWSIQGLANSFPVRAKVFRSTSTLGTFVVVGQSAYETVVPATLDTFLTRIPVLGGDLLGLTENSASADACYRAEGTATDRYLLCGLCDPSPGSTQDFPSANNPKRLNISAKVEPDSEGDGFGDETQDACLGTAGSIVGCPRTDLQITNTSTQGSESDLVTYTLVARNNGPDPAPDGVVSDTLPVGATFVSVSGVSGPAGSCGARGRSVSCQLGPLTSGSSSTLNVVARLKAGTNTNSATISSAALAQAATKATGAGDPNPANNAATATVNVLAPSLSSAKAAPSRWRLGSLLPRFTRRARVGTTISFKLSEPAKTTLVFSRSKRGRKVGKRCVAPTRSNKRKPRCTRHIRAGRLTLRAHAGTNKVRFQGRLSRTKKLKLGRYLLTIIATDSAANASRPKTTAFTIVR